MELRICKYRSCRKTKPITEFRQKKNGRYNGFCNTCTDYFLKKQLEFQAKHHDAVILAQRNRYKKRRSETLPEHLQRCQRCTEIKPKDEFGISRLGRLYTQCPPCREYCRLWNRQKRSGLSAEEIAVDNKKKTEGYRRVRRECIAAYGGKCVCCGEKHVEFLAIDHTNGGGQRHRIHLKKAGTQIAAWLKSQGYPQDEFRLLCHNCNNAMGFYGYCPHNKKAS